MNNGLNFFLIALVAIVIIGGGAALVYFLLKKYFSAEGNEKGASAVDKKAEKAKASDEKKAAAEEAAKAKAKAAAEKRKAEMMKKTVIQADPKVLEHRLIKQAADEITKFPQSIDKISVKANRIDWAMKEEYSQYPSGNIFFDDPALHRLEAGEMKLVAEHLFGLVKKYGFEMEEVGTGEKGTHRYHVEAYVIKAL